MIQGQAIHLGDGAYLYWTGYSVEFRANDVEFPTDIVSVDMNDIPNLIRELQELIKGESDASEVLDGVGGGDSGGPA